jgi:hypothetical protein
MITLPVQITGVIVTIGMGFFLTAVAMLCIVPLVEAVVEKRMPDMPKLPPVMENLGIAIALGGLTFRMTDITAVGVGLAVIGVISGIGKPAHQIHPVFEKATAVIGVVSVGVLAEFYFVIGML